MNSSSRSAKILSVTAQLASSSLSTRLVCPTSYLANPLRCVISNLTHPNKTLDLSLPHFILPPLFHILENGTTNHPLSHPNKNLQVTLLFTFSLIQSISKSWFYLQTISQTCPFLSITLVVAMTTMQYPNWPPCFHSFPPTVHSLHRSQEQVSS